MNLLISYFNWFNVIKLSIVYYQYIANTNHIGKTQFLSLFWIITNTFFAMPIENVKKYLPC